MGRKKKPPAPHPAADLFGEIPVTWPEVFEWVRVVVPRWHGSHRVDWYIQNFRVIEKIQAAKRAGIYEQIIQSSR